MKHLQTYFALFVIGVFILALALMVFLAGYKTGVKENTLIQLDYQIQCYPDSLELWDGERRVGVAGYDKCEIDSLILKDNL